MGGSSIPFYRFRQRFFLPRSIRSGFEIQYEVWNDQAGQPWKIDFVGVKFEYEDAEKIPSKYQNDNLSPI